MKRSEVWRVHDKSQLLPNPIQPHVEVAVSTVSRSVKEVLTLVDIDTSLFRGYSNRSASSSTAGISGVSVQNILSQGRWSKESTSQKFYDEPVISTAKKKKKKKKKKIQNTVILKKAIREAVTG